MTPKNPIPLSTGEPMSLSAHDLQERIRIRAYELYEQRGREDGHDIGDWLQAESELTQRYALLPAA